MYNVLMDGFGARLRGLRMENNFTQKALAEILNVSIPTLSHWECDYQEPSFKDLANIGRKFDISIDYLLGIEEEGARIVSPMGNSSYTAEERKLIEDYRQLSFYKQELIKNSIKAMLPAEAESKLNKKA